MSFNEDDEPKTKPEEKEKKDKAWDIGDIGMAGNDMMMMVVLLGVVFLFKDEIMGLINNVGGDLPASSPAPAAPEAEAPAPEAEGAEGAEAGGGGAKKGKGRRGGRGAGRVGSKARKGMRDKARQKAESESKYGMSYFGIANV